MDNYPGSSFVEISYNHTESVLRCIYALLQIAKKAEVEGASEDTIKSFFRTTWSEEIVKYQEKDETSSLTLPFTKYLAHISEVAYAHEVRPPITYVLNPCQGCIKGG